MITIKHTHESGTLIEGSAKGDGVYDILKGLRGNWRYFPSLRQIGLGQSRDKLAKTWDISQAAEALRNAGHEVTVEIDESQRRDMATIEADRAGRAVGRAERYSERAERTGAEASATYAKARQMSEVIPFGQPMMPDHHSYGRDRNYRARIGRTYERAFEGMGEAERLQDRAEAAEANQSHRESVPATLRRIAKLEADERSVKRNLAGRMDWVANDDEGGYDCKLVKPGDRYRAALEARAAELAEQIAYWREHIAKAEASGAKVWTKADFAKGDFVLSRGTWYEVQRVNAKSLAVPWTVDYRVPAVTKANAVTAIGPSAHTSTITYDDVRGRKSAAEMAAEVATG